MKRRQFVHSTLTAGLVATSLGRVVAETPTLAKTPWDYEGPYYPKGPRHRANDLIRAKPRDQVLQFRGRVVNTAGQSVPNALIDLWQTDRLGRYKHPGDQSPGPRWDDFLYWGESTTNEDGHFEFRTYVPGAYGGRPAHIHYKVWANQQLLLTSQVYFAELGGTKGKSRFPQDGERQTTHLTEMKDGTLETDFQVVV